MDHPLCRRALYPPLLLSLTLLGCSRFNESLNRGLENEKSYTRQAMEYHRKHPDQQRGDGVLETWSKADYIAEAVEKHQSIGVGAHSSDQLAFLPDNLKWENGKAFCIVQLPAMTIVLYPPSKSFDSCTVDLAPSPHEVSNIKSGDMQFSGRTDAWVYVLKHSD